MNEPVCEAPRPAHRLIPSRYPPVGVFDTVATPEDARAAMVLEGWTNDRLVAARAARLPDEDLVYGMPNASVVLSSFLHASITGGRFTGPDLGGWYAAAASLTAILEVAHHMRREAVARGLPEARRTFRRYVSTPLGRDYVDLRGTAPARPELYDRADYRRSQIFGERVRASGAAGIVYDSVRHRGGVNVVVYRARFVSGVVQGDHYDIQVPLRGRIVVRQPGGGGGAGPPPPRGQPRGAAPNPAKG